MGDGHVSVGNHRNRIEVRRWGSQTQAYSGQSDSSCAELADSHYKVVAVQSEAPSASPVYLYWSSLQAEDYIGHTADEAAQIFWDNGFVIIPDAISIEAANEVLDTCLAAETEIIRIDSERIGNRGQGRYSFGGAALSGQMFFEPAYRHLINSQSVQGVLDKIWGRGNYCIRGGGGDFVTQQVYEYQALHADISRLPPVFNQHVPPMLVVNFAPQEVTLENGPMRIIPQTGIPQNRFPPDLPIEPDDWKHCTCPLRRGSALLRDLRVWHGGTPNWSSSTRFLPCIELMHKPYAAHCDREMKAKGKGKGRFALQSMPHDVYEQLSEYGQLLCKDVVTDEHVPRGFKSNLAQPQGKIFDELALGRLRNMRPGATERFTGMRGPERKRLLEMVRSLGCESYIVAVDAKTAVEVLRQPS